MQYTDKVMKEFTKPKNQGEMEDYDGLGRVGSAVCGDVMEIYIKISKNKEGKEIIKDIKFKTFGCTSAIASSSMLTQMVKGKTIEEAEKITKQNVVDELGGLPPIKIHCSVLATDALKSAIDDYKKKKKLN